MGLLSVALQISALFDFPTELTFLLTEGHTGVLNRTEHFPQVVPMFGFSLSMNKDVVHHTDSTWQVSKDSFHPNGMRLKQNLPHEVIEVVKSLYSGCNIHW